MGTSNGSIHIRSADTEQMAEIVKSLAAQEKQKFLISPCINGWISVYPSGQGQDSRIAGAIAKLFPGHLLHLILHDEDVFYYIYYRGDKLVDEYSSVPDYFETVSREEKARLSGKPEVFADLLAELPNNQTTIEEIAEVLTVLSQEEREQLYQRSLEILENLEAGATSSDISELRHDQVFQAAKQFSDFAQLFNISNASTCYEYLQHNEHEQIERWEEFVHIPDPSIELAEQQREKARIDEALTELNIAGILLVSLTSPNPGGQFPHRPISAPDEISGFFIGWDNQPCEIKHYTAPWNNEPANLDLPLEQNAYVMQVSPSGKFLTVGGRASGSWQATLYDLEQKQLLKKIPHVRLTSSVQFTPNEEILVSRSEDEIIFTSIKNSQQIAVIKVGHGSKIAIHPDGRYLLADEGGSKLAIIDLNTQKVVKVLSTAALDMTAWMASVERGEGVNGFSPNEMIGKMDFSPDGRWLLCAMDKGVRVFEWNEVFSSKSKLPLPIVASSSEVITVGDRAYPMARTYDIAFDWQCNILLSCGLEGKVKSLDLATGKSKVLLEIPGKPAIIQLNLSRDLATFCTHSIRDMFEHKQEPIVQIWNYLGLG